MNKEEAIKVIQEEMTSWISENMDSALIFKYISRLEEKLKNSIPKQVVLDKIEELDKNELLGKMNFEQVKFTTIVLREILKEN